MYFVSKGPDLFNPVPGVAPACLIFLFDVTFDFGTAALGAEAIPEFSRLTITVLRWRSYGIPLILIY